MTEILARSILESLRCGVAALDLEGRVTALNLPARQILGLGPEPGVGADCREVFRTCPGVAHLLLEALRRDALPDRAETVVELDGRRGPLIGYSLSRICDEAGQPMGGAIFFKDLTRVEEEREREALRRRLASLGEMAAQLAHELRNRLGGVRLFVGLARRRAGDDPETRQYLERAEGELLEANGKMTQVLDFVRPLRLDLAPSDPVGLCRSALEATLARFPEARMRIAWDAPGAAVPPILADARLLQDALAHLFANAVEATGEEGRIGVRIEIDRPDSSREGGRAPEERVRIEIDDDGPGMSPDVLRRIFHPFFTTKENGSGLGIPAAQKVVDAHGGTLDVRSQPGEGTTFVVLVPGVQPPEEVSRG